MKNFNIIKHGLIACLFFVLWPGANIENNVSLAANEKEELTPSQLAEIRIRKILKEIMTPWRTLSDDAIQHFIQFANEKMQQMPEITKKFNLLEVTITQWPSECVGHSKRNEDDLQILYGGGGGDKGGEDIVGHYICVHYRHRLKQVLIYDSLGMSLHPRQREVLKILYPSLDFNKNDTVKFIPPMTRQRDGSSCGLFSIAYATLIIFGQDPHTYRLPTNGGTFIDHSMPLRQHLYKMLTTNTFSIFPVGKAEPEPVYRSEYVIRYWGLSDFHTEETVPDIIPTSGLVDEKTHNSYKFVAKLFYKTSKDSPYYLSSATILSDRKIVTAAQNVANSTSVVLSFNTLTAEENTYKVEVSPSEIIVHPRFEKNPDYVNDVAVIVLKKALKNVTPIKMVSKTYKPSPNHEVSLAGYSNGPLSYINANIKNFIACRHAYFKKNSKKFLEDGKQFCVNIGNLILSEGWVGGPVITKNNEFAGVISYDYEKLPEVCTLASGPNQDFINNPKIFRAKYLGKSFFGMM